MSHVTEPYTGSPMYYQDIADAKEAWLVKIEERTPLADGKETVMVKAEAGTGSNYVVVATPLGPLADYHLGGDVLVTVYWPWQDAWVLRDSGPLSASYVAEHLTGDRGRSRQLNGGDLAALTLTVAHVLGRKPMLDA